MAHNQQTRDNVRRLYIEGMPLTAAALTSGVSYETARDWKAKAKSNGDDWDISRTAYQISDKGVDEVMRSMIDTMMRQSLVFARELETSEAKAENKIVLLASLADTTAKFSKAMMRINPKLGALSVSLDTLKTIADYLSKNDKVALVQFQEHLEGIGAILQSRYG